jgi:hypothetical protein
VLSAECRVQNVEFATIRAAGRDGGTKARRDPPEAGRPRGEQRGNCQNGRRRPTAGNRDSGIGNPPERLGGQARQSPGDSGQAGERAKSNGTWNPPEAGRLWNLKLGTVFSRGLIRWRSLCVFARRLFVAAVAVSTA